MDFGIIRRGINHYHTRLAAFIKEKKHYAWGTRVKYMFYFNETSDTLVVSFPGCSPNSAKYNYMRTLLPFKCNKLFLLDDFGDNHQGCYLIEDNTEKCVIELIESIVKKTKAKTIIFLGSSKGGYSALNFSFLIPNVTVVIGAPQYYLGKYLDTPGTLTNLKYIIGDEITAEKKDRLDNRLRQQILNSRYKPKHVYIHYSEKEHTYPDHVKDMLTDLRKANIDITEDIKDYHEHEQLVEYYPAFLKSVCSQIINQ